MKIVSRLIPSFYISALDHPALQQIFKVLYVLASWGGLSFEVPDPNDSVTEGCYRDYNIPLRWIWKSL